MPIQDAHNDAMAVGDQLHGYRIERISPLPEINAVFYRLIHEATGARHLHISRPDQENVFGVTFKTVPADSTGVAHILEHTVLCGSRTYPVRDPFFSMLKRSLSTFMNAFTSSDWTMYPFATQNAKDFYNLMDVYLDAAFFPLLHELSFKQEGHRLEFEAENGRRLLYKGVVYNEMKGAMSSPDQIMGRSLLNALYPDTTYSNNSGGDPAVIPKLSYAQLKDFHARHYHPSNAYFYSYGNMPLADHLAFIEAKIMHRFARIEPHTDVPPQPRWDAPRTARYTYPLSGDDPQRKSQISLAWLTCDIRDTFEVLVLSVLEQILLGNAGSPLRKALMDSGLGSALSDATGYDSDNRDTFFACGLKDTEEDAGPAVEKIILDVLQHLVEKRIDVEHIASAIHQIEFHRKEITNTPYPYGLKLLMSLIGSWLHGGDPERILQLDADMARLRAEIEKGPFLEERLRFYFLENRHRVRMLLAPDQKKSTEEEARLLKELQARERSLDSGEKRKIEEDARELKQLQERQEDVGCLPTLALADIPPEIASYPPTGIEARLPVWRYDQPTSGIFYFSAASAAGALPRELLPWVPFFCYAFSKIGTARYDYSTMAQRIDAVTGGFKMNGQARVLYGQPGGGCLPLVSMSAKCLSRNVAPTLAIIEEMIAEADFGNRPRLKQLLGEYVAGLETVILQSGHRLAISLSARAFAPASALAEIWGGVHQIRAMRAFNRKLDERGLDELSQIFSAIAAALFQPGNMVMAVIGEQQSVATAADRMRASPALAHFERRPDHPRLQPISLELPPEIPFEGWSTSSAVAFVARTQPTVPLGPPDAPALAVLAKLLRSLYLHREIREKGGAYGGFALYNAETGLFSMASYRDPHITRTIQVFGAAADFFLDGKAAAEDIKEAILQVCSEIDKPDPPGPAARKAFGRLIVGLDDDARRAFKRDLLTVDLKRVETVVERYFGAGRKTGVAVIAGREHLETANREMTGKPLALDSI